MGFANLQGVVVATADCESIANRNAYLVTDLDQSTFIDISYPRPALAINQSTNQLEFLEIGELFFQKKCFVRAEHLKSQVLSFFVCTVARPRTYQRRRSCISV
jgi:hypothetical protein